MQDGKTCVKRIGQAASKFKSLIDQWRNNNPSQKEEPMEKVEDKQLAQVQTEIDEATESSKKLEDEFEDDAEGKAHRDKPASFLNQLKAKVIIGRHRGCKTNRENTNVHMSKNIIALALVTSCCARNCCSRR